MPSFRYNANDAHGRRTAGEIEAASSAEAKQRLAEIGLEAIEVVPAAANDGPPAPQLSRRESEEVVVALAELSNAELPLAEGLRAAAAESTSRRVARALRSIAGDVERGYAVERIMNERGDFLPPHVRGLVAAAAKSRRLGLALDDLIEHHRATREVWARVVSAISYPLIVLGLTLLVLSFIPVFVVPQFKQMFEEYELELPVATQLVIGASDALQWLAVGPGKWVALAAVCAFLVLLASASLGMGTAWSQRFASTMPLIGPIWRWSGVAAFARLLATMLEYGIPLPEAIRLASDGVYDPDVCESANVLAEVVEEGSAFSEALAESNRLPATMTPFVRWGEQTGNLPDGLRTVSEMFLQRLQTRTLLLQSISPPVVFIFVGMLIGFFIVALFMPLVSLIQALA